jgi:hypothetical protein
VMRAVGRHRRLHIADGESERGIEIALVYLLEPDSAVEPYRMAMRDGRAPAQSSAEAAGPAARKGISATLGRPARHPSRLDKSAAGILAPSRQFLRVEVDSCA